MLIKCLFQDKRRSCSHTQKKGHFKKLRFKTFRKALSIEDVNGDSSRTKLSEERRKVIVALIAIRKDTFQKIVLQISSLTLSDDDDVKSLFSLDDEATLETLFSFQQEESDSDEARSDKNLIAIGSSDEEYLAIESFLSVKLIPMLKVKILPIRYHKPIPVTALFDIGTSKTIMNPEVLPTEF